MKYFFIYFPYSCIIRIENHAEHGGTLNEHQLNRLVIALLMLMISLHVSE